MKIGVIVTMESGTDIEAKFVEVKEMGMDNCQLVCWDHLAFTDAMADKINKAVVSQQMEITAFWCGWDGPKVWDFYDGPLTLGLVPTAYRAQRLEILLQGCDFAKKIQVRDVVTHVGFLSENPNDAVYAEVLAALRPLVEKCKTNGQYFLFETGQETPVTLKRVLQDLGSENVGVNLDPANLLMYGKANPIDALDVFGKYVRGVHGKDGEYPTDGHRLGAEVPLGKGKVDYPRFIAKLKEVGYDGSITIEREISGEEQIKDILEAKKLLEQLL
ncbi:sugar phosphate isomerase/epimerase [Sphaerochaeta pleomorpha str. Grapes]|uniref:Sugar phosphate isomerase/epimerase n=1 Tax=Sphaerochaeta pleomorpha (strain ATCC BAA-1885 / DSM 22778 / Grapes) TaxID=158190 RepID=G8QVR6_SPHPG|nr:sugar phosphate isomerase/epimerase family protein [Sphaerochaeta pleomorpha]AEV29358.1 sugar phosphate isomerase/epimerase [Sphaerochaeta pleomorpha str. Grapes]